MLAKETKQSFDDKDWLFEIKWDGYRAIAEINGTDTKLYSRNGISFLQRYPLVTNELKKIKHAAILDGEVVVLNEQGRSDFQKLQDYENNTHFPMCYYVFDLLSLNSLSTTELPLIERKKLLKKIIPKNPIIKFSDHIIENGNSFFKAAIQKELEGIMAKKMNGLYLTGTRSSEWLKIKHHNTDDVIIVGYTEPTGARRYFGALVLAIAKTGELIYAGHTGSGFNEKSLKEVYEKLQPLIIDRSPFTQKVKTNMPVTWVQPKYVCEVKFTEWTKDGRMRHPIFLHLREDKTINDMLSLKKKNSTKPAATSNENEIAFGKIKVAITNRNKLYWPKEKITKGMMIDYYQSMADYILPYLKDRPESLKRNPNGISDKGFFHKDAGTDAPSWIKSKKIYSESAEKEIDYIICNDKATLAYLNNLGCIELNPWNSTIQSPDKPDYMIIDIDPSEKNTFDQVIETALQFKKVLDKAKAGAYCKTSGATGLHIFVPMQKKYNYEEVKNFAHILCRLVNEQLPQFTSLERNLQKRGSNKIYLDYLQNRRGQTISSAYSLRPVKGASVSTPLQWKEVKKGLSPADFTIANILPRVKKLGDIFKPVLGKGVDIKKCLSYLE
ncbi:DNA ligase D [Ferruginibacter albus]|uniref:DNA ligase D n=1 Tax=Ferruginibacter albus TaxID=2875540 RepID=UPI001CC4C549|nr:DNA ligase D [Ferruginibacter albus]